MTGSDLKELAEKCKGSPYDFWTEPISLIIVVGGAQSHPCCDGTTTHANMCDLHHRGCTMVRSKTETSSGMLNEHLSNVAFIEEQAKSASKREVLAP
jgi:hypothetical protein